MQWIDECISEIKQHSAPGYHRIEGRLDPDQLDFSSSYSTEFLSFLSHVGYGSFFSGGLTIYKRIENGMISDDSPMHLSFRKTSGLEPFGYNGTTEGCFCFRSDGVVCWALWHDQSYRVLSNEFSTWVVSEFKGLFSEQTYKAYRKIKNPELVEQVIQDRKLVSIRLKEFDLRLVKKPGEESILSRYNRLLLRCDVASSCRLKCYTFIVHRVGSEYGADNKWHVSISIEPGVRDIEVFVFDPFNVKFTGFEIDDSYEIDLSGKMRTAYKEIVDFL